MMNVTRPSEAVAVETGRCVDKIDRVLAERALDARLLAAAGRLVAGERRWFALRTRGCRETELVTRLSESDVDAVVPVKTVPVRGRYSGPSRRVINKPVLAGLVFVNMVPSDAGFAGLLRVKGVAALVGHGARPAPIGDREMHGFMDLAQAGAFNERATPHGIAVGSRVKIRVGAYADFEGVVSGYAKGRTARVMTMLFGRDMLVDVGLAHLQKVD